MKVKATLMVMIIAPSLGLVASAHAAGDGFVSVRAGQTSWSAARANSSTRHAHHYGVSGGYRWRVGNGSHLGLAVGYIDSGKQNTTDPNEFISGSRHQTAFTFGASYRLDFAKHWYFVAGAGLTRPKTKDTAAYGTPNNDKIDYRKDSTTGDGHYLHAGIGYAFSPHFGLSLNYGRQHARFDLEYETEHRTLASWSAGLDWRFD